MTDETKIANPYNARKEYDTGTESPRGVLSADESLHQTKKVPNNTEEQKVSDGDEDKPYHKVNYKKRYDDLKRHYDSKVNEWKQKEQNLQSQAPKYEVPKTPEDLANFKNQYPEVYGTIETVAYEMSKKQISELQEKLNRFEARENQIQRNEAESELAKEHPDFKELRSSPVFHKWVQDQPAEIQNWLYKSLDPKLAAKAISLFKKEIQWEAKRNVPSNKDASSSVRTKGTNGRDIDPRDKIWTTSEIKKLSSKEFESLSNDIDKAYKEGRVIKG